MKDIELVKLQNDIENTIYSKSSSGRRTLLHSKLAEYIANHYELIATNINNSRLTFLKYEDGFWKKLTKHEVGNLIQIHLKHSFKNPDINSIREVLANIVYTKQEMLNHRHDLINLNNCAFNLKTFKPELHDKEHYFTFKNNYDYNPDAKCPEFTKAIEQYSKKNSENVFDEIWIRCLWEIIGYCLTGNYEIQKMFWFTGSKGGNGKGTVLRVMQNLVGSSLTKPNFQTGQLKNNFYKGALIGKRLAITGDSPEFLLNIDAIKELTGGDQQSTDIKFGDQVDFYNTAKLVSAMNRLPDIPKKSAIEPILRRVVLLPFDYVIKDYDPDIETKFRDELSGIFNSAIDGLKRLRKNKIFTECERGKNRLKLYAGEHSLFDMFCENHIEEKAGCSEFINDLWNEYREFYYDNTIGNASSKPGLIENSQKFASELKARYPDLQTVKENHITKTSKKGKYVKIIGLKLIGVN